MISLLTKTHRPWPWTQHTHNVFVFFFFFFSYFQIPLIHKHWRASYQTLIEKHEHVFQSCFFFFIVFCLFFNQGQMTDITYRCCRAWLKPIVCWHGALYSVWGGKRKKIKAWHELRGFIKTKGAALVLEMVLIIISGATRCMHSVFSHTDNLTILQKTFFEYNM